MTRTYAQLEISPKAWQEIYDKLSAAGYQQSFHADTWGNITIDMHGIGLSKAPEPKTRNSFVLKSEG